MLPIALGTTLVGPNKETFQITGFVGRGGFGEVYRAVGQTTGTVVAVKLLPLGEMASAESRHALLNEVRASQEVRHTNVVEILHVNDGGSSQIGPYVVMEYVPDGTLANLLESQSKSGTQIPLGRVIEMMIDIAEGANAINAKVIHRDIKPDNVLIKGSTLKIGDFGISKFADESTRLHTFKGVQHMAYKAPESWKCQTNTFKMDVYSVGLVFYEIVTLKHPLQSKVRDVNNFHDWEDAHLFEQCPDVRNSRSDIPLSIAQLLTRMVNKKPEDRPSWDDVLKILRQPEAAATAKSAAVSAAVQAVFARQQELEKKELQSIAQQDERQKELVLYRYSCVQLLEQLKLIIDEFNRESQHGQITTEELAGTTIYRIPHGQNIQLSFFRPHKGIKIRNGEVIGGGWLGLSKGRSANLVLLRHGPDDLYGSWSICEVKIMGLIRPHTMIGKFGLTKDTVEPFGFKDSYFYDQIQFANGAIHVFLYNFRNDVADYFTSLLLEACK
jgi:serine/threonine protein kinase